MTKIIKYNMFETVDNEKEIIINTIVPFCLKKYEELSKWAKKKTYRPAAPIQELMFEKKNGSWVLTIEALSWSGNDSNMLIQYVLGRAIKDKCTENGIKMDNVSYAGAHSISDSVDKYIVYDVQKNEVKK